MSVASVEPSKPMELLLVKDANKQMKLHGDSTIIVLNQTNELMYRPSFTHFSKMQSGGGDAFCPILKKSTVTLLFLLISAAGRQTVLVHHQTGLAAVAVTTLGYQLSHLTAAKVPSPVSLCAE